MSQKKRTHTKRLYGLAILAAGIGVFVPGMILTWQGNRTLDAVTSVPEEYYSASSSVVARNASAHLEVWEKMQLITGTWESERKEADLYEVEQKEPEAVENARAGIRKLYDAGLYPETLDSDYGNWYTWEAQPYKAVDAIFMTYTAFYWKINFQKYDGTQTHTVYLLEDGTVFLAYMNAEDSIGSIAPESSASLFPICEPLFESTLQAEETELETTDTVIADKLAYFDGDTRGMEWLARKRLTVGEESYEWIQAKSHNKYLAAFTM